jgi:hypothetical protein
MESLEFKVVSVAEARAALDGEQKRQAETARGPETSRTEAELLLDATIRWMASLPDTVRPTLLARRFPRIANGVAELWPRVARCEAYLDSLIVDERGGRKGFPIDVAMELTRQRGHYADLHPTRPTTWDGAGRAR